MSIFFSYFDCVRLKSVVIAWEMVIDDNDSTLGGSARRFDPTTQNVDSNGSTILAGARDMNRFHYLVAVPILHFLTTALRYQVFVDR